METEEVIRYLRKSAGDYPGRKGTLIINILERPGSYDGCAFSFSGKYGTSCFYQASIGMKLSPAGVEKVEDWMYSCQRNYSGLESLIEIDIADI